MSAAPTSPASGALPADERAAFEAWWTRQQGPKLQTLAREWLLRDDEGVYDDGIQEQWEGWQARAKAALASPQVAPALTINGQPPTAQSLLAAMVDIYDDAQKNPPEHRCYADEAWYEILGEARSFLAAPAPVAPTQAQGPSEDLWYLQDTRSYIGNDVVWWAKDGNGYTTDVSKAQAYTREKAFRQAAMRGCDRAWPKAYIDGKTRPAVDFQHINHSTAFATLPPEPEGESHD